jgi:hypothetical protein
VQVADDPLSIGQRVLDPGTRSVATLRERAIEAVVIDSQVAERLALGALSVFTALALAEVVVCLLYTLTLPTTERV